MDMTLLLAVEEVIPPDHPVAILAIPLGLLFMSGSIYVLLWSNFGARKAAGIYGTAFFGWSLILGVFWWFGGPGIPPNLGITNLPGQAADHYDPVWYAFEPSSERAGFFSGVNTTDAFQTVDAYVGRAGEDRQTLNRDPAFAALSGSSRVAIQRMQEQFLPVDQFGVARIGVSRRSALEAEAAARQPAGSRRGSPFYTAQVVDPARLFDDPSTGLVLATATFQVVANFTDAAGTPLDAVPVGEPAAWFAFYDPGANWFPSALWTIISLIGFALSLVYLDRVEQTEKRLDRIVIEQPEDLAVPIAQ